MIPLERRLRPFHLGRIPDWLSVYQQPQIVSPDLAGTAQEHPEVDLSGFAVERKGD